MSENFDDYFDAVKLLGEGSFGSVLLVKTKPLFKGLPPNTLVAAKLIDITTMDEKSLTLIENEIAVLERLSAYSSTLGPDKCNQGVVCYYGNIKLNKEYKGGNKGNKEYKGNKLNTDKENRYYIILMEYIDGFLMIDYINSFYKVEYDPDFGRKVDVYTLGRQLSDEDIISILRDLAKTLSFIHSANVVHRDIKIDNIMLSKNKFKYIDFGLSCINLISGDFKGKCNIKGVGTPLYISPELVKLSKGKIDRPINSEEDTEILKKTDVWALGMVFFIFVNGFTFFETDGEVYSELLYSTRELDLPEYPGDPRIDAVITKMLTKDYHKRPSADDVYQMLK